MTQPAPVTAASFVPVAEWDKLAEQLRLNEYNDPLAGRLHVIMILSEQQKGQPMSLATWLQGMELTCTLVKHD